MSTYFCSDPHAFHGNIMKYCRRTAFMTPVDLTAFLEIESSGGDLRSLRISEESIDRMNRGLVANINARVGSDDVLWCLGDWAFGYGGDYFRNARWFRDQLRCRTINFIWGNHDDRRIGELFAATFDQVEINLRNVRLTLNHYPMLTWSGQHHGSVERPNIHLYGHVHAGYQRDQESCPIKFSQAWAALDVGFDGHDFQVWSLDEILDCLCPKLQALEALKRESGQFDPFRGRAARG